MSVVMTPSGAGAEAEHGALFPASFTASEGAQEGALIGQRVQDLLSQTSPRICMSAGSTRGGTGGTGDWPAHADSGAG